MGRYRARRGGAECQGKMKPIQIKLRFVFELILGFALGFAALRAILGIPLSQRLLTMSGDWEFRLPIYVHPVLNAIVLVQFVAILFERPSRLRSRNCGLGRWTWAFAGVFFLLRAATSAVTLMNRGQWARNDPGELAATQLVYGGVGSAFPVALMASWVVLWFGPRPVDPAPDEREFAGLIFGSLLILWWFALNPGGAIF